MRTHVLAALLLSLSPLAAPAASSDAPFAESPFAPHALGAAQAIAAGTDAAHSNRIAILNNGYEALLLRVHLIRNSSRSIKVQTFIWSNDEVGRLMMYELIRAARRGVSVQIIADHMGSSKDRDAVAFLATVHPNLEVRHYRPTAGRLRASALRAALRMATSFRSMNQRMHNKLMLFDDLIAITGGRNIDNSYHDHATGMNFKDRDAVVVGPVAALMARSFGAYWDYKHTVPSTELRDVARLIDSGEYPRFETRDDFAFHGFFDELDRQADESKLVRQTFVGRLLPAARMEFLTDRPGKTRRFGVWGRGPITRRLEAAVAEAEHSLIMQSPYLILGRGGRRLFRKLRKRRPDLRVVVSSNSFGACDHVVTYSQNYRLRRVTIGELDFEVYEYRPHPGDLKRVFPRFDEMHRRAREQDLRAPFLCIHAKSMVVDDRVAFIGSFNLDPRSAALNTEAGLLITDEAVAAELKADILRDARPENSWVIAKSRMPLQLDKVNALIEGLVGLTPLDVWPLRCTSSFALKPGREPVPPGHPEFYERYDNEGSFPGAHGTLSTKEITARVFKAIGGVATPLM